MLIISQMEDYLEKNSPYDYEDYLSVLYNFKLAVFRRKLNAFKYLVKKVLCTTINKKRRNTPGTESKLYKRTKCEDYCKLLKQYDVISFDVFDTLILRAVLKSSDLFYLVGIKLQVVGFKEMREMAEKEARFRLGLDDTDDVKLSDIYSVINEWCGIDIETGIKTELEVEDSICSANPYWFETIKELEKNGKKIIATTDMYMSEPDIRRLLYNNGYTYMEEIFVSCDVRASKRNGGIYDIITEHFGSAKKYIHIGDNRVTDYKMAKCKGWDAVYYKNVHDLGKRYRDVSKSIISDSVAGGIIDAALHNGKIMYDPLEEFGFNYYGRLHIGYCQWLERIAREKHIDKFLFVSRDGYLLKKIYNDFFNTISSEYVYVSRYALSQIIVLEDMDMFLQQNLEPRAARAINTIQQVLEEMGLQVLINILKSQGIAVNEVLSRKNYDIIKKAMYENKAQISAAYEEYSVAAEKYFSGILQNCKVVCIVDVGWYGTCTRGIYDFIKKHMRWEGSVFGAQIGIECGKQNIEMYARGILDAYVFSPDFNKGLYKQHDFEIGNVINEIVFSAPEPSLLGYRLDGQGNVRFDFMDEPINNIEIVKKVQQGVYEYVKRYCEIERKLGIQLMINADTAYKPVLDIGKNRKYLNDMLGSYYVHRFASTGSMDGVYADSI